MTLEDADISIRRGGSADIDAVDALEAASFGADRFPRRNLQRMLASPSAVTLLAEKNERALGYLLLLFRKGAKAARLYSLATAPDSRGQGIASSLVRAGVQCAIKRGSDRLRLEVRASNLAAIRLYDCLGFRVVDQLPGYYSDGEAGLRMECLFDGRESGAR